MEEVTINILGYCIKYISNQSDFNKLNKGYLFDFNLQNILQFHQFEYKLIHRKEVILANNQRSCHYLGIHLLMQENSLSKIHFYVRINNEKQD